MPTSDPRFTTNVIEQYAVLDRPADEGLQGLVELAALVCGVPNAAINLITDDHQHQVATAGIDRSVCARQDSMCAAVLDEADPVVCSDASTDPRFASNPFVTGAIAEVRFYASAPLVTPAGTAFGRLCVFDDVPHELTEDRRRVLAELARRVVDVLELRLRTRQLERSLDELTRTRDELHRSNELLTLFAGQVSHDLRSPLTAIIANTELLADEPALRRDADLAVLAEATLAAGHRMEGMIRSILDFTRVGAHLRLQEVDLGRVVGDAEKDLALVLETRGAQVRRGDLPRVSADREQLYVVVLNLLSNAVKFTPASTMPLVEVLADRDEEGWVVRVRDNGRGIAAEDRKRVFELYRRGSASVEGSGIGLATARRVVEAHGGRIGVADGIDGGAEVWFTLPG